MDWWNHLTQGQGTLLGGLAVLVAGLLAFSTGWFDRRGEHRQFHYQELKNVYTEALELVQIMHTVDSLPTHLQEERVVAVVSRMPRVGAALRLTGNYQTADRLIDFIPQEVAFARSPVRPTTTSPSGRYNPTQSINSCGGILQAVCLFLRTRDCYARRSSFLTMKSLHKPFKFLVRDRPQFAQ